MTTATASEAVFTPRRDHSGDPPLEDVGLIGDGTTAADGLPGDEGAFLLCSFWLVDNLAAQGRLEDAMALYESLCGRAGTLGLLPEKIHPSTGGFLGNHPQAFSHVGVVSSGMNLARALRAGP